MAIITLQPDESTSKDAYVPFYDEGGSNKNDNQLRLGYYYYEDYGLEATYTDKYYIYIQFDLSAVSSPVASATLSLYRTQATSTSIRSQVRAVTSAWGETTINSFNLPTKGTTIYNDQNLSANSSGIWDNFDVTNLVNDIINGTIVNNGFVITADTTMFTDGYEYLVYNSASTSSASLRPKLVLDAGDNALNFSPSIGSASTVTAAFSIPAILNFPTMALGSTSTVTMAFDFILPLWLSPAIASTSKVTADVEVVEILVLTTNAASSSWVQLTIRIIVPEYLIMRGYVSIGGVPVTDAYIRVLSDDGQYVFTTTTDGSGNYEIAVNTSGVYHVICYKKDIDGSIYSSVVQPFIEVTAP